MELVENSLTNKQVVLWKTDILVSGVFHPVLLEDFVAKVVYIFKSVYWKSDWNGDGSFRQGNICILRFCKPFYSNPRFFIYYSLSILTVTKLSFSNKDNVWF